MSTRFLNRGLLIVATCSLILGFFWEFAWAIGGFSALLPSLWWVLKDFNKGSSGSDILVIFSLLGTILTDEFFAAAVIALMLGSGRVLEGWAAGKAERELKSFISGVPTFVKIIDSDNEISEIAIADVQVGMRILIRSGEITPTDGEPTTDVI
jgi:cation transport ATPase